VEIKVARRFISKCQDVGRSYHQWGWAERLHWIACEFAGKHLYKGVSISNDDSALFDKAWAIAQRAS